MKKNLTRYKLIFDNISKTGFYRICIAFSILLAIYGSIVLGANQKDFFNTILISHSNIYFNIIFFSILFINTINTCSYFSNDYNYVLRLTDKRKYIEELMKIVVFNNFLWCVIFSFLFFSFLNITQFSFIKFYNMNTYGISISVFAIYYIIRYYLFAILFSLIISLFYIKYKDKKTYILILFFFLSFITIKFNKEINTFLLFPSAYFHLINYGSFINDLNYSLGFCIVLEIMILALKRINIINKKCKYENLYYLLYNIQYIIKKQRIILILLLIIPILIFLSIYEPNTAINDLVQNSLGLNIDNKLFLLPYLGYLFYILSFLFITFKLFIIDFQNITNIYLRYDYKKYFYLKALIIFILIFIIKMLQYLFLSLFIKKYVYISITYYFILIIKDVLFNVLLGLILILLYILYKIHKKKRIMLIISILIAYILIGYNTINISSLNAYILLLSIIFLSFIINKIICKQNKIIIQEIGGV